MSRARGRNPQRQPTAEDIKPGTPEGKQLGLSDRVQGTPSPIPGGRPHISNSPAIRHQVPTWPSEPEVSKGNAHGVIPGTHTNAERAEGQRGPNTVHPPRPQAPPAAHERPAPIPVFVVEDAHRDVLRSATPRSIAVPGTGSDPIRLCGIDGGRSEVMLLNESTSTDVRFAQRISDLNNGGGALLPWPTNSYQKIKTQDALWAVSATATAAKVSVIQVFERDL